MRNAALVVAVVGVCGVAIALQSDSKKPDVSSETKWESSDGAVFEVAGVCNVTPEKVTCWSPEGAPDTSLEARIYSSFSTSNGQAQFVIGKKNRYVIIKVSGERDYYPSFRTRDQRYINGNSVSGVEGSRLFAVNVATDKDATSCPLQFDYQVAGPPAASMEFSIGKRIAYAGKEFTLSKISENKTEPTNNKRPTPRPRTWSLFFAVEGTSDEIYQLRGEVLDKSGKPIRYVDRQGEPVSAIKYMSENKPMEGPSDGYGNMKYSPVSLSFGSGVAGAIQCSLNVNPERIGSIKFSSTRQMTIELTKVPLDPISGVGK